MTELSTEMIQQSKKKQIALLGMGILLYVLLTLGAVAFYRSGTTQLQCRMVQNMIYLLMFGICLLLMWLGKQSFSHYGWSFRKLGLQIGIGLAIGAGLTLFMMMFGDLPRIPQTLPYVVLSQLLVGMSEEAFWRGFVLQTLQDLDISKNRSILLSSLLFGLCHFPIQFSMMQVLVSFVIGLIFAALRTEFKEIIGIPTLLIGHAWNNIF